MKTNRSITFRRKLVCVAVASCFAVTPVYANPLGATVVNGQAGFATQGNTLTITSTPNAIINWQQFSIGAGEITRFEQLSASSAVLNRVVGQDPSRLLGSLISNGRVFLINPNGILFGQGAVIDVAGLVASTLRLSDADFLAGRLNFTDGASAGSINNQGGITTPAGGSVYLIAPDINNSGVITSPQGEILLAAGHTVNLMDAASPNVQVTVGAPDAQVVNIGSLIARSGKAGIYGALIDQQGMVNADTAVAGANGRISLRASKDITLEPGSVTTASGMAGGVKDGGEIRIVADGTLNVRKGSEIHVDGGVDGGNGGFLELSGKTGFLLRGSYTGHAQKAGYHDGSLLLDPLDINIVSGGSDTTSYGNIAASSGSAAATFNVDPAALDGWANVSLAALRNISINSAISNTNINNGTAGGSLTMNAGNNISVAAPIGGSTIDLRFNHDLTMQAGNNVNINADIYMGANTLIVRSGANAGQLGFAPYACSPCARSIFITPAAANPVTVDVQGGIELYTPSSGAVNIHGGIAGNNQDASVTVHGGTVMVNAGSVNIQGGAANASASSDTSPKTANASASMSAGTIDITTTTGGLTVQAGSAHASASSNTVTATANARLISTGAMTLIVANGMTVKGGNSAIALAHNLSSNRTANVTTHADATVEATGGLLDITVQAGGLVVSGGSSALARANGRGSNSATATGRASVLANAMDIKVDGGVTVSGGDSATARAEYGNSSAAINQATVDVSTQVRTTGGDITLTINTPNGSGNALTIRGGGNAVARGSSSTGAYGQHIPDVKSNAEIAASGKVEVFVPGGGSIVIRGGNGAHAASISASSYSATITPTVESKAQLAAEGGLLLIDAPASSLNVSGGSNARASQFGAFGSSNVFDAHIHADATLKSSAAMTLNVGSLTVQGGNDAGASVNIPGATTAVVTANALIDAASLKIDTAGTIRVAGSTAFAQVSVGSANHATAEANATIQVSGNLEITNGVSGRAASVQIAGGWLTSAHAYGTSGSGDAAAYANASVTAGSLTLRANSLSVRGGNTAHAQAGSFSAHAANRSATAESKALLQVNGPVAAMDIGAGGLLVEAICNCGTALAYGAGGVNTAFADRSALINITGNLNSLTVAGGGIRVLGGDAHAEAHGSGSNTATEYANGGIEVGGSLLSGAGGIAGNIQLRGGSSGVYAYASNSGNNKAYAHGGARMAAGGDAVITVTAGSLSLRGGDVSAQASSGAIAAADANAIIAVGGNNTLSIVGNLGLTGGSASVSGSGTTTAQAIALLDPGTMNADITGDVYITGGSGGNYNGPGALAFAGIFNTGPVNMTIGGTYGLTFNGGAGGPAYGSWIVPDTGYAPNGSINISYTGGGLLNVYPDAFLDSAFIMNQGVIPGGLLDFTVGEANGSTIWGWIIETIRFGDEFGGEKNDKPVCN